MQQNIQHPNYIQEDEIDLRELFLTIWKKRVFIISFTLVVTVLAVIYALVKTPIYEAKALVAVGHFFDDNGVMVPVDDARNLSEELSVVFIDLKKDIKDKKSWLESAKTAKRQNNIVELVTQGLSRELAIDEMNEVVGYIQNKHQKVIDDIESEKRFELENFNNLVKLSKESIIADLRNEIEDAKTIKIPSLDRKIKSLEEKASKLKSQIEAIEQDVRNTREANPALSALIAIEKRSLEDSLASLDIELLNARNEKVTLQDSTLPRLEKMLEEITSSEAEVFSLAQKVDTENKLFELLEKQQNVEKTLLSHRYKNSEVLGEVVASNNPVKPKKKLIVVVAFVTGFILSIFIVFLMDFIKSFKEEGDSQL
jgi:uncharacterized protein involved in exopolysaccharide biosynthesis